MSSERAPLSEIVAGNLLCPTRCAAILVCCSLRDWTRFLHHPIKKYPDSPVPGAHGLLPVHTLSDSLRIYFFPLWRAYLFFYGFAVEFAGYMWTVAVSGKKTLLLQKILILRIRVDVALHAMVCPYTRSSQYHSRSNPAFS